MGERLLQTGANFNLKETNPIGANLILMGNASRAAHEGEGWHLVLLAAVALAIVAAENHTEKRKLMRMGRQAAWGGVLQVGENGAVLLALRLNCPEERASAEAMLPNWFQLRLPHQFPTPLQDVVFILDRPPRTR